MKVIFRVDASTQIGTGHAVRCRTLADALRTRGAEVQFICRAHSGHMGEQLSRDGFPVTLLPSTVLMDKTKQSYADWLGVSQAQDASETIAVLKGEQPDWLVIDHYSLDAEWERALRSHAARILVIDDLADRQHECDLLLDQNYCDTRKARYQSFVPSHCQQLLGPHYALLRPEYSEYRKTLEPRTGAIKRILVFMGGSDNSNYSCSQVLEALNAPGLGDIEVDIVIGSASAHKAAITRQATDRPHTQLHGPRAHLADLMAKADLAIGAGGATTWERMCMGLPSMLVCLAENQRSNCETLSRAGLIHFAGSAPNISAAGLIDILKGILENPGKLKSQITRSQTLVDGLGTARVIEIMWPSLKTALRLRPARSEDALACFTWANDQVPGRAHNSLPNPIDSYSQWFDQHLNNSNTHFFVLEANGLPVGQVHFESDHDGAAMGYALDALVRGRGWTNELNRPNLGG